MVQACGGTASNEASEGQAADASVATTHSSDGDSFSEQELMTCDAFRGVASKFAAEAQAIEASQASTKGEK